MDVKITLIVLSFLLIGCSKKEVELKAEEKITNVNVMTAERKLIKKEVSFPGQAKPSEQIPVVGKVSGKVDEVFYKVGDQVNQGDILFTIDTIDIQNNIKSLEAQLETANATIKAAETGVSLSSGSQIQSQILQASGGVSQSENALKQAKANEEQAKLAIEQREISFQQAQNNLETALKTYNDSKILYESGVISRSQFEQAETAKINSEYNVEQAKSAKELAQNNFNLAQIAISQAQSSYDQAIESKKISTDLSPDEFLRKSQDSLQQAIAQKDSLLANLEIAKEKLNDVYVKTPISGIVSSRNIEPKIMISNSIIPFTIVQTDVIEIKVLVTESIINSLEIGQEISVYIKSAKQEEFVGKIVTLSPAANEMTSTFEIRISIENKDNLIKPGMYAEVFFTKEKSLNDFVIPRGAIINEKNKKFVFIAEGNKAKKIEVITGIDNGDEIQIIDGIEDNMNVVIKGQSYLKDGSIIFIEEIRGENN